MLERITFEPEVMGGKACIRGMRIPASLIVSLVANGMTTDEILTEYPDLEREIFRKRCKYAALLAQDKFDLCLRNLS